MLVLQKKMLIGHECLMICHIGLYAYGYYSL